MLNANIEKVREQILEALKNVKESYTIAHRKVVDQLNTAKANIRSVPQKQRIFLILNGSKN